MVSDGAPTAPARGRGDAVPHRRTLLVMRGDDVTVHALPLAGELTIGRGADADIQIDEPSISRQHLALALTEHTITAIDRGSANGSSLRGVQLPQGARVAISPDDVLAIGDVMIAVQDIGTVAAPPWAAEPARPSGVVAVGALPIVLDPAMQQLYELAGRVARGTISVLVAGETGAGKEMLCELLHARSPRAGRPFVRVNCAALTESLLESELFGHDKGAFTGAHADRAGYLEAASGGTLMLDEVGELPAAAQAKLLRVVEEGRVVRLGSTVPRPIDVRFVAATNRDLEAEATAGLFRRDLYFRLAGVVLAVPPLRERPAEIEALATSFAAETARRLGRPRPRLTGGAIDALRSHPWPGNVRELRNVIERAVLIVERTAIDRDDLGLATAGRPAARPPGGGALSSELADLERHRILEALERCTGNQTRAAAQLGMPRRTLIKRLTEYGVARPRKK
jgi:two-component system, NtrC family, response regulator AtoC